MGAWSIGRWGTGNEIGLVYRVEKDRLGNNEKQPKHGTMALCVEHTGDCFYDYVPLFRRNGKLYAKLSARFGSYALGDVYKLHISDKSFHRLMAGLSA